MLLTVTTTHHPAIDLGYLLHKNPARTHRMSYADDLSLTVERARARLLELSPEMAGRARAPGTWSPAQIIGHLIDSASNNH